MFWAIGGIISLLLVTVIVIIIVISNINSKDEKKFLDLHNSLTELKKEEISCKPSGKLNNSYSQGKASLKTKADSLNKVIMNYIKIFTDYKLDTVSDYLIESRKEFSLLINKCYKQIESVVENTETRISSNTIQDTIFSAFRGYDEDLSQKGVNVFYKIDIDINNFIDKIIINLITIYSKVKNYKQKTRIKEDNFIKWLKEHLTYKKIIPIIIGIINSFLIGLLVNYVSSLIIK